MFDGTAYDSHNLTLYISIHQTFVPWAIPFHAANVSLITILHLVKENHHSPPRYLIRAQNDLYQVNEMVKFVSIFGVLSAFVMVWQLVATGFCVLGAGAFWPVSWLEQNVLGGNRERGFVESVKG